MKADQHHTHRSSQGWVVGIPGTPTLPVRIGDVASETGVFAADLVFGSYYINLQWVKLCQYDLGYCRAQYGNEANIRICNDIMNDRNLRSRVTIMLVYMLR